MQNPARSVLAALVLLVLSCALVPSARAATAAAADAAMDGAADSPAGIPVGRLTDAIRPTAYRLDLTVDPAAPTFSGHAEIDAVLEHPVSRIFLHGRDLDVSSAIVAAGAVRIAASYTQVDPGGVVRLDLPALIPAGPVTLIFDYTARFRRRDQGLFRANVHGDWYAWTQFEPSDARRMFPGFDEPGFKTPFTLTVRAPREASVFANSPELQASPDGARTIHRFAPTAPLPTYLVSIAVGPFDVLATSLPPNPVRRTVLPFRVIAPKGELPRMQFALNQAPRLLALLERYIGLPYPYAKLDLIASPREEGAMENAGLIIFENSEILLGADASLSQLREFATTCAHEMAHQWVGDLVTPTWWDDVWLNEAFAEWLGNKIAGQWRPDLDFSTGELDDALSAMQADSLGHARPIRREVTTSREIEAAFDEITYLKGAQVLAMFESFLGPAHFASALRLHLERFAFGNASTEDFLESLTLATGDRRAAQAMRTFLEQSGLPVVTIHDGKAPVTPVTLAQSRYAPLGGDSQPPHSWLIPVCLGRGATRDCTLLTGTRGQAPAPPGGAALMPNAGGTGYYRFRFEGPGWDALLAAALSLTGREALAVADSIWADFAAGTGSFAHVIAAAQALSAHPDHLAAAALAKHLSRLASSMLTAQQSDEYRNLIESIYAPRLTELGLDLHAGTYQAEPAPRRSLRQALLPVVALQARNPQVRARLAEAAQSYLRGDTRALDPDFLPVALTVAVQDLGSPFMQKLAKAASESPDSPFADEAASAIGAADTPTLAQTAVDLAASGHFQELDTLDVLTDLSEQPAARDEAVRYTEEHLSALIRNVPEFHRAELAELFAGYCSLADAARAQEFIRTKLMELGSEARELARVTEQIRMCAALKSAKQGEIDAALAHFATPAAAFAASAPGN